MKKLFLLIQFALFLGFTGWSQPGFQVPGYEKVILKNGLTLYLMEQHEVPLVEFRYVNQAGAILDGGKMGLSSFTADAVMYGAKGMSRAEIEETFDAKGARINPFSDTEMAGVAASFHKDDAEELLGILANLILSPSFDPKEFEEEKERRIASLEQRKESPREVIGDYFNRFMFGSHPYGNPADGTVASVTSLSRDDLSAFYQEYWIPGLSAIAVVGDFDARAMKSQIKILFEDWTGGDDTGFGHTLPQLDFSKPRVLLVDKPDARETTFYIGAPGVKMNNPDYVAISVVNTILGGRFTSWLNDELRVNSGLTYGARSRFNRLGNAGTFYISSFTKTSTTFDAIDLALEVVNRLHEKGIDAATLESARNYVKGNYPPKYETSGQLAGLLTDMFIYGFDESIINTFQEKVDEVDVQKAREIVAKYFPKENMQFLLIGKAAEIREGAAKYGEIEEVQIEADGY